MNGFIESYSNLDQHQKVMYFDKQTLKWEKQILDDKHPNTLRFMNGLAKSYFDFNQHQRTIFLYIQILKI